ncbi:hypothetical protein L6164_009589 [Bauhinia variegata]|uniref:Uncharacterized protein n=1 Tax=Bauhinia variegata TaxID=167791 RepID=A0ACB9PK59_BAUVA|nr:hypothetical protein L6164_009589 [Bauhinia variegata]
MAVTLHHNCCLSSSSSNSRLSPCLLSKWGSARKIYLTRHALLWNGENRLVAYRKPRRTVYILPFASADDGVTVDGDSLTSDSTDLVKIGVKLNKSLEDEDFCDGLLQSLHDAARVFELAIKEHKTFSRLSWFSAAWLGIDQNAWVKELSYQAAVYALLQAASEISCRSDGRDENISVFVQTSLLKLSTPLESLIREKILAKLPEAYEWFWSEQVPAIVASFVNKFEGDARFIAATSLSANMSIVLSSASDPSLLMLALTCIAAITKLGPAKVSCSQFFSLITEITGSLMDRLVDLIPITQAYNSMKDICLHREFLVHFGPRAAACRSNVEWDSEEVVFWVSLAQKQLQQSIDKERIWSRLTTSESIEVLEKDLAIFGFFIALGRSTRSFLSANGFDVLDNPIEDFITYLVGGSILYYPQLSSISTYQFYVEVVCEELDWLPFYSGHSSTTKQSHAHTSKQEVPPNAEAVQQAIDVCFHWMQSFIKYSTCLESPSNVNAATFLSIGHDKLMECLEELEIIKDKTSKTDMMKIFERNRSTVLSATKELDTLFEALESLEATVFVKFLQALHFVTSSSGEEHLKVLGSELEKIQKLKTEARFLEVSFRAKVDFLQEGVTGGQPQTPDVKEQDYMEVKNGKDVTIRAYRNKRILLQLVWLRSQLFIVIGGQGPLLNFQVVWAWFYYLQENHIERSEIHRLDMLRDEIIELEKRIRRSAYQSEIDEENHIEQSQIHGLDMLRDEIIDLKKRDQRSAYQSEIDEDMVDVDDGGRYSDNAGGVQEKANFIEESLGKLKATATDVWQGTRLLAIDVAAAMGLVRRAMRGDELTEKEKRTLKRTLFDLAAVFPIGFFMLLPVTAVGHAAMLAAIKKYFPALIPSTYTPDRLDLLRQIEKVKEMTANSDEKSDEVDD